MGMQEGRDESNTHAALRRIGTTLCGRYRIRRLIGIGGMSAVYAGTHRNGHPVAIKILHERLSVDPEVERIFRREALLANAIRHPSVVPITDDDVAEDGSTFLVMPLLSGETVRARAARNGMRLPLESVIVIARALLDVLQAAHTAKIVHRDIKPDNIFITDDGQVRVLDFGIARFFETSETTSITGSGRALGTPPFMAPEQALGRVRDIDGRTDIWAVGATMFTLLAGRYVHPAESASEMIVLAATRPPTRLSEVAPLVPSAICEVIDRALSFGKAERWLDPGAMNEALCSACASTLRKAPSELRILSTPALSPSASYHDTTTDATKRHERVIEGTISHGQPPRASTSGSLKGTFAVALALAFAVGIVAGFRERGKFTTESVATDGNTPPLESSPNAEAQALLKAGLQHWRDASTKAARKKFAEAAQRDPGLATAHLFFAAASERLDPETRTHFSESQSLRGRLSPAQVALLHALAPSFEEPPNFALTARHLETVTEQYPSDDVVWMVRGGHAIRTREAPQLLSIADHIPGAIALWLRARAELQQDDLTAARKSLDACVAAAPQGGVNCLVSRAKLEANEGACEDSALAARRLIAIDHDSPDGYTHLARAEFGRSHRTSTVRAILDEKWARVPEPSRELEHHRDEFYLSVLDGEFDRAYAALDARDKALVKSVNAHHRAKAFIDRFELDLELGRTEEAKRGARTFIEASQTWVRSELYDQAVESTVALYRTGQIDRDEMLRRRAHDETGLIARGGILASPGVLWYVTYVEYVVTTDDAKLAVARQPPIHPVHDAEFREVNMDQALGRTYLYADQIEKALQELRRGVRSCLYTSSRWSVYAHALYGDALAKVNRPREACDEYAYVLQRWGREPRSNTARKVRESAIRLGCSGSVEAFPRK
ncbi:protein kinase domain-containing protein [Pendulispora albinea]|uniref:Serine/threonine protein kinase n=1 Tax=Pendulispora albinea TaxID=2741071 RepID=A0ABZ2LNX0_9BACT